ncbi:uncharacterized protein LOC129744131 [Uranotaenia lowii]|uniref:uncharacterized protein LOC129744131 n=1 Tax=Uranotaenia lowii TaxID=190385 RepID=UPI0024785B23|nr:uncharacterized protein LOC129744131 [Uranotaenia lowii]
MDRPKPFLGYDNNVGLLINKFEVRNYPKNRKMAVMPQFDDSEVFVRARRRNSRDPPIYVNDSGVFYESNDGLPQTRFRNRYTFNESLSSLNESDYGGYEPMIDEYRSEEPPQIINKQQVASSLSRFGAILQMLSKIPFPRLSVTGLGLCSLVAIFICPRTIGANVLFPGFRLLFGTLYPAYASYKAVRTKNVKEYVKWMMYWIVFALFTCIETFTDILLSWFPFYYEIKVILVLWLLSPATRGSSTLYRKFVHPMLTRREQEIDDYINQAKEKGYTAVLQLGSKGVNYATNVIMQTAIKGGGGLVQTLRKSYSLSDLSEPDTHRTQEEIEELMMSSASSSQRPSQRVLRSKSARSSSGGRHMDMYFPEVELAGTPHHHQPPPPPYNYIRSSDDISSGYSSAEPGLSRTASMSNTAARPRVKSKTREEDYDDVFYDGSSGIVYNANGGSGSQFGGGVGGSATLYELPPSPLPAITQESHAFDTRGPSAPIYTPQRTGSLSGLPEIDEKYELFLQWMESQKKDEPESKHDSEEAIEVLEEKPVEKIHEQNKTASAVLNTPVIEAHDVEKIADEVSSIKNTKTEQQEQSENSFSEDLFRDTISVASDDDEFMELEVDGSLSENVAIVGEDQFQELEDEPLLNKENAVDSNVSQENASISENKINEGVPDIIPESITDNFDTEPKAQDTSFLEEKLHISEDATFLESKLHISEDKPSHNVGALEPIIVVDTPSGLKTQKDALVPLTPAGEIHVSLSDLTASTTSLANSEASSVHTDDSKKPISHGKRKAPPVPVASKIEPVITTSEPTVVPKPPERATKQSPSVSAPPRPKKPSTQDVPAQEKDKKTKSNKLMSSITGMFKHDHSSSASSSSTGNRSVDSGLPKETEI